MNTYLIASETIYYINEKLKELTQDISNIVKFNLSESTIDEVLQEASYFSMFDDKKCIIVKNSTFFGTKKDSETSKAKDDSSKLLKYLENENPNTTLIFVYNGKCDSKKKIYNLIKNAGNLYSYTNMTKTNMKIELNNIVKNNKYQIDDKSLWYIINNTLGNFDLCVNELNKIFIYYSNPGYIKYEDVIALTSTTIEDNNFKLVDSIIKKDFESSLKLLQELKILKTEPNIILSLIYREFNLMLTVQLYEKMGLQKQEILDNLGMAEWQLNKIYENLRYYRFREIKDEIVKLSRLDYENKSGLLNKDVLLIKYILGLCD